jgi:hypothetical protein
MTTYLVTCYCGKKLPVEIGQAGGQVVCDCGAAVSVPTLRQLRHLPRVESAPAEKAPTTWGTRKGIAAAALIAAVVLAATAGWSRYREPVVPPFPTDHVETVSAWLDTMKPVDGWNAWISEYHTLGAQGFREHHHPHAAAIESYIADKRFLQKVLVALAVVSGGIALAAAVWPNQTRRQGDKETRRN